MEITPEPKNQPDAGGDRQNDNWFSKDLIRFFEKVQGDWDSGCWNWTASQNHGNYSQFWDGDKPVRGHRWIYETFISAIPTGLELDHLCVNPSCVAPYHLEPVTRAENQKRKALHRVEAAAGRPIRIKTGATTVREITFAFALGLPVGGVIVLPARPGAGAVRSTTPAPYGTLPMPSRPIQSDC
jgi:hypothetical protein